MKLYYSPHSPYVRKTVAVAAELGLLERIELVSVATTPVASDAAVAGANPMAKIPTLLTDDGRMLADSRVICEYLDNLAGGGRVFPAAGPLRWQALVEQAAGDGLCDASILIRYETMLRPGDKQWPEWIDGQMAKVRSVLDFLVPRVPGFGQRCDIGTIAVACALSYLDHRYADMDWRAGREALGNWYDGFAQQPCMQATAMGVDRTVTA